MRPGRQLATLARKREALRARIRSRRETTAAVVAGWLVPLGWIDLGLRVRRLLHRGIERWRDAAKR